MEKTKVLYITGWGRSGSTILGRILGQSRGNFMVGEIRHIWDRGLLNNNLCSCGVAFRECPLWSKVLTEAFGGVEKVEAQYLASFLEHGLRTKQMLLPAPFRRLDDRLSRMQDYMEALSRLYEAVGSVTHSNVIVDTSKVPAYGYVLGALENIDLYVLHLVRDPRATAFSWYARRKPLPIADGGVVPMPQLGIAYSSLVWDEWNLISEMLWSGNPDRYMRLRYEDFIEQPRTAVEKILRFVGKQPHDIPVENGTVRLDPGHTFSGNPGRFSGGLVVLEPDEEWRRSMGAAQKALVTAITLPGLLRYGYPLFTGRGSA